MAHVRMAKAFELRWRRRMWKWRIQLDTSYWNPASGATDRAPISCHQKIVQTCMGLSLHVDRHVSKRSCGPTCRRETFASQKGCRSWTRGAHWLLGWSCFFGWLIVGKMRFVVVAVGIMSFTMHTDLAYHKLYYIYILNPIRVESSSYRLPSIRDVARRKSRSATGRMLGQVSLLRVNSEPNLGASRETSGVSEFPGTEGNRSGFFLNRLKDVDPKFHLAHLAGSAEGWRLCTKHETTTAT